jgi:hypothetical protein
MYRSLKRGVNMGLVNEIKLSLLKHEDLAEKVIAGEK